MSEMQPTNFALSFTILHTSASGGPKIFDYKTVAKYAYSAT
jgi:hypothetical protein